MTKRISLLVVALGTMLLGCGAQPLEGRAPAAASARCQPGETQRLSEDVEVACVAVGVWVFIALAAEDFTYPRYPANGLLLETDGRSVLVDTGWRDAHAETLLAFARERGHPITAAMATHAHQDRVGGVAALQAAGVPVFATADTIARAAQEHAAVPDHVLVPGALGELEWLFPGAGHSPDNLVVWHPSSGTLFGGCLIKSLDATSPGYVAEADPVAWPLAIDAVRNAFPEPARVVPGHGAVGGVELLAHTASLLGGDECGLDADCIVSIEPLEPCSCCGCVEPRALAAVRARELGELAQMSCQPICEGAFCAPCAAQQARMSELRAACVQGVCVVRPHAP